MVGTSRSLLGLKWKRTWRSLVTFLLWKSEMSIGLLTVTVSKAVYSPIEKQRHHTHQQEWAALSSLLFLSTQSRLSKSCIRIPGGPASQVFLLTCLSQPFLLFHKHGFLIVISVVASSVVGKACYLFSQLSASGRLYSITMNPCFRCTSLGCYDLAELLETQNPVIYGLRQASRCSVRSTSTSTSKTNQSVFASYVHDFFCFQVQDWKWQNV